MQKLRNAQHSIWTCVNSTLNWRSSSSAKCPLNSLTPRRNWSTKQMTSLLSSCSSPKQSFTMSFSMVDSVTVVAGKSNQSLEFHKELFAHIGATITACHLCLSTKQCCSGRRIRHGCSDEWLEVIFVRYSSTALHNCTNASFVDQIMFPVKERFNKCVTKVAANNFVEASFVSSKEGFQQKFPQKLLQVLLKQVFFP